MGKPEAVKSSGIGIIPASDPFQSPQWKKARAKALAYDPFKSGFKRKPARIHLPSPSNPGNARFFAHVSPYSKKASHGKASATTGMGKRNGLVHAPIFYAPKPMGKPGEYTLGRVFDARNPKQLAELKALKNGAKTYDQAMTPVRVTYIDGSGKIKTEEIPLLFVSDRHLTPPATPVRRSPAKVAHK